MPAGNSIRKTTLFAAACLAIMAGCKEDASQRTQTRMEVAEIKGIAFNDPLPASETVDGTANASAEAATDETALPTSAATPVPHATAEDIPEDIAMIPSATPVPVTPTPEPTATPEVVDVASAPAAPGDFQPVPFKVLSGYKYVEPIPGEGERPEEVEQRRQSDQIPAEVKALDGTKAIVEGWMVPMEISEDGSVRSFVLVNTQPECCFGDMQAMNEWVDVYMNPGKNAEFNVDLPVKVYGQLEVGEKKEDGFVLSIYRMKADRVEI